MMVSSRKIASGFGWIVMINYSNRVLGFVTTLILARLLAPSEFGLVAIASMLMEILNLMKDMGFGEALIYQKREDAEAVDTANTMLVGTNAAFFLVAAAASPFIARWYDSPVLMPVIIVMSSNLVWNSASAIPRSLIRKRVEFQRLFIPEVVPVAISSSLSIWMALTGFGVWSLVAKTVVHSLLSMVLLRRLHEGRIRFGFDPGAARELFHYGKFIVSTSVLLVTLYNIDRFFVSRVEGLTDLGYFEVATRFAELPVKQFALIVGSVMFPVFTRLDRADGSMKRAVLKTLHYAALISVPMAVGMATFGPVVVRLAYGTRWEGMVGPLRVLAFVGMIQSLASLIHDGYKAHGRPDLMQRAVSLKLAAIALLGVPALWAYGIVGIAVLMLLTYSTVFLIEMMMLTKLVGLRFLPSLSFLTMPAVLATLIVGGGYGLLITIGDPGSLWQVILAIVVVGLVYLAAVYRLEREAVADLRSVVAPRRQSLEASAPG
jgi:O-antigen/teichoic acid export membrane protein